MNKKLTEFETMMKNKRKAEEKLLANIKKALPELKKLLEEINGHWVGDDLLYRFFHGSFKVYYIQDYTIKIISALKALAPKDVIFNSMMEDIVKRGTGIKFQSSHNKDWNKYTEPQIFAFFISRYFLEMAIKYGEKLDKPTEVLFSGWAGLLYFYGLR